MPMSSNNNLPETEVTPDETLEKRTRRVFTPTQKRAFVAEADRCGHGELGAFLRRERLYSNQINEWRRAIESGDDEALSKSSPGPKSKLTPEQRKIEQLEREKARLERKLEVAEGCIELQKKLSTLLEQASNENDS